MSTIALFLNALTHFIDFLWAASGEEHNHVRKIDADKTVQAIEKSLLGKIIKNIDVTSNVTIVALIGAGMRGTVGAASKVFGAVAKKSVNVVMITQGSSELNLAFVVRDSDARKAVNAVHNEFKLGN